MHRSSCEIRVANPAPITPRLGIGPQPRTRTKASKVFKITEPVVISIGVLASLSDRNAALVTVLRMMSGKAAKKRPEVSVGQFRNIFVGAEGNQQGSGKDR